MPIDADLLKRIEDNDRTLTTLGLSHEKLNDDDTKALAHALETNTSLTGINLSDNAIGDAGAKDLAHALETNASLTSINLYRNNIGAAGAKDLAHALETNASLTVIDLNSNAIRAAGAKDLAHALEKNASLTVINLSSNAIRAAGAKDLAHALETNTALTGINLSGNAIGDAGAKDLAHALETNASLTGIDLGHNNIGAAGAKDLAHALETNASLTGIVLYGNNIGDAGVKDLAHALETNTSLTVIRLGSSAIGAAGAKDLARALETNASLTVINLNSNAIGAAGAKDLAHALEKNASLTEIRLNDNNIGDAGAKDLAHALEKNASLTEIYLDSNNIGDAGAKELARALENNASLTEIYLGSNNIGDAGAKDLAHALEKNASLTEIDLNSNAIRAAGREAINKLLERNKARAQPYEVAKKAYDNAKKLIAKRAASSEIIAAFTLAQTSADEGIENGYPPSRQLLQRIEAEAKAYQAKPSGQSEKKEEKEEKKAVPVSLTLTPSSPLNHSPVSPGLPLPPMVTSLEEKHAGDSKVEEKAGYFFEEKINAALDEKRADSAGSKEQKAAISASVTMPIESPLLQNPSRLSSPTPSSAPPSIEGDAPAENKKEPLERKEEKSSASLSPQPPAPGNNLEHPPVHPEPSTASPLSVSSVDTFSLEATAISQQLAAQQAAWQQEYDALKQQAVASTEETAQQSERLRRLEARQEAAEQQAALQLKEAGERHFLQLGKETEEQRQRVEQLCQQQTRQLNEQFKQSDKSLNERISALQAALKDYDNPEQRRQLDKLQAEHDALMTEYREKQQILAEQREIECSEPLRLFYRSLQIKLQELFLACKTLDSGMVAREKTTTQDKIAQAIQLAGECFPLPGASIVTGIVSKGVQYRSDKAEEQKAERISHLLVGFAEIDRVTEHTARELTLRYTEQLKMLTLEGAKLLGECGVKYMLLYLSGKHLEADKPLMPQLIEAVTAVKAHNGWFPKTHKNIPAEKSNSDFTDDGLFKRPGIKTADHKFFHSADERISRPDKYGYRLGTEREAKAAGMMETTQRILSANVQAEAPSALSMATSKQLTNITQIAQTQSGQLELLQRQLKHEVDARARETMEFQQEIKMLKEKAKAQEEKINVLEQKEQKREARLETFERQMQQLLLAISGRTTSSPAGKRQPSASMSVQVASSSPIFSTPLCETASPVQPVQELKDNMPQQKFS
jgi:Ran GTPase-activating protein (RanGAP) involved in mRNA processing and transport